MRSLNKVLHHKSLFLKGLSIFKISEKNPVILMIKTFKILNKDNLKETKKDTKNIENK